MDEYWEEYLDDLGMEELTEDEDITEVILDNTDDEEGMS